jgi:hypothetical protein
VEVGQVSARVFNTPLEAGLRALFLMSTGRRSFDSQRLIYLDYILVHSGDLGGAESIHPQAPGQKSELLVRRELVQEGLSLMKSRDLIERRFTKKGITYRATNAGRHVAEQFGSSYAGTLRDRAGWVIETFGGLSEKQLSDTLRDYVGAWEEELIPDLQPPSAGPFDA